MLTAWIDGVLARRRLVLGAALVLALAAAPGLARLETDNSARRFLLRGSPAVARYAEFVAEFGGDELVRVVARGPGLWTPAGLAWLRRLEQEAAELAGVRAASGLPSHAGEAWPPADTEAFRAQALEDPLARALGWIDATGDVATLTVVLAPQASRAQDEVLEALEGLLETRPEDVASELTGLPVLNRALDRSSREIETRFFPLLALVAVAILALAFRQASGVAVPLLLVGLAELVLLGAAGWLGVRLNLVLAILPPLLFSVALSTALHLLTRFRELRAEGLAAQPAVREAWRDKGAAVLWTGVTTCAGFGSLAASPVAPVRSLGLLAGAGIGLVTLAAFTLYPALLVALHPFIGARSAAGLEPASGRLGRSLADAAARQRAAVLLVTALTAALAAAGLPRLALESNALTYFAPDHPVRADIEDLERRGIAAAALELVLEREAGFADGRGAQQLAFLALRVREETRALGALGAGDLVEAALRRSPDAARAIGSAEPRQRALEALRADARGRRALGAFLSTDGRRARLTVFTPLEGHARADELRAEVVALAREELPEAQVETTGQYLLLLETQHFLLATLRDSLLLTLVVVTLAFAVLLRGARLVVLALVPNLWPVLLVLGGMGWTGMPLDIATVMVASVVLGLAVDNTIHTLAHFREREPGMGARAAVAATLARTAPAYLLTGVILAAGFGVCVLSDFAPIRRFGGLSALALGLALLADLVLVPALLAGRDARRVRERGAEP